RNVKYAFVKEPYKLEKIGLPSGNSYEYAKGIQNPKQQNKHFNSKKRKDERQRGRQNRQNDTLEKSGNHFVIRRKD
ncbi:MAG: hypothetical protein HUJ62_07105, partial [Streptococcus gallolyticus]|nr:hypothetical protein [Streptococcus gallolyticus]